MVQYLVYKINTLIFLSGGINVADNELEKVLIEIDKHHKSLETKYNVLVKRTNSMIKSLSIIDDKLDFLLDKMSMFEFIEEAGEEDEEEFDPYHVEPEDYEDDSENPESD